MSLLSLLLQFDLIAKNKMFQRLQKTYQIPKTVRWFAYVISDSYDNISNSVALPPLDRLRNWAKEIKELAQNYAASRRQLKKVNPTMIAKPS